MKKAIEVIVVDDQEEMIDSIKLFFQLHDNIKLKGKANSGKACLELMRHMTADIILMDIKMESPKAGIKAAEEILKKWQLPIIIIFLTAYPNIEDIKKSLDLGCSFVDKQCSIPRLIQIIEDVYYKKKIIIDIQPL